MIIRSRGSLVVEIMTIELEIKTAFSKLTSTIAQYNDESADIVKIKEQFSSHESCQEYKD